MVKSHCGYFRTDVAALLRQVGLTEIIESDTTDEGVSQSPSGVRGDSERSGWQTPRIDTKYIHDHGDSEDKNVTLATK